MGAEHFRPGGDQVHLLWPGDDVHGQVEAVVLQEETAADEDLRIHRMRTRAVFHGMKTSCSQR